jgi:hypothetical protein
MTSLGAMMAGGNPAVGRKDRDWYATPDEATIAALKEIAFEGVIHECACGDGAMARLIERHGHRVVASDIHPLGYGVKRDFFTIERPVAHNIMSNPPFGLAERFIRHGQSLRPRKMAFLLKSTYFAAKNRRALFEEHPPAFKYELTWRLDFSGAGKPVMECAWFVWEFGVKREPHLRLLHKPTPAEVAAYREVPTLAA